MGVAAEQTWLARAQQGEAEAFDALLAPHLPRAYRTAWLITHDPEVAGDALQEALLRAPPRNARTVDLDGTEALCFDSEPEIGPMSVCGWVREGLTYDVSGPDLAVVLRLARSVTG